MPRSPTARLDRVIGDGIEAAVRTKHRLRLRRLGWQRALEPSGDTLWALGDPSPRPGCSLEVLIDGAQALPEMAQAMQAARQFVHITGWHIEPSFELERRNAGAPPTHHLLAMPEVSRRSRRLLGPLEGLVDDG
jgi:hypothetical protein